MGSGEGRGQGHPWPYGWGKAEISLGKTLKPNTLLFSTAQGVPVPSSMVGGGFCSPTPHIPQEPSPLPDALLTQSPTSMC